MTAGYTTEDPVTWPRVHLRRIAICRDDLREPINALERALRPGPVPYWGANSIQGFVDAAKVNRPVVLLGEDGAPFFDRDKPVAFYVNEPIWPNNHIHVLIPRPGIDAQWLAHALNNVDYSTVITGSTRDKLTQSAMLRIQVALPPIDSQRKISAYLHQETAEIDALVAKQKALISSLEERRLAVITREALGASGVLEVGGRDFRRWGSSLAVERALAGMPAHWRLERFKSMCSIREQRNINATETMLSLRISGKLVDRAEFGGRQEPAEESIPRYLVADPGDLVVNPMWLIGGSIGVTDKRGAVSPDYRVFKVKSDINPWYLHAVVRSKPYFDQYRLYTRSNTTFDRRIKQVDLDNLPIPVPPLAEQARIIASIGDQTSQIDNLISKAEQHVEFAKERRSALISAVVTGQIDVTGKGKRERNGR